MPLRRNQIPEKTERELFSLIDRVYESTTGVIFYETTYTRARYLQKWLNFLQTTSALTSVHILDPSDPKYALGDFWNIKLTQGEYEGVFGIFLQKVDTLAHNPGLLLINTAFLRKSRTLQMASHAAANALLNALNSAKHKMQKKGSFPEIYDVRFTLVKSQTPLIRLYTESALNAIVDIDPASILTAIANETPNEEEKAIPFEKSSPFE